MAPFSSYFWEHPLLKKFLREVPPGEFLFHQGDEGRSMFIVLTGVIELVDYRGMSEHVVTLIEPGEFLGEQAIIRKDTFHRIFGARPRSTSRVLELDWAAAERVQRESPPLFIDILRGVFSVASDRLARANEMIRFLRSHNNEARLLSLYLHFAETIGVEGPQGIEVTLEKSTIRYYVDMSDAEIHSVLSKWEDALLISLGPDGYLTIFDAPALEANLRAIAEAPANLEVV